MLNEILTVVANYFLRVLTGIDGKALDYLKERGITSANALSAFMVGYANAGISKAVSEEQRQQLQEAKLVDSHGRSRFKSSITFPLFDSDGNITDICGMNLGKVGAIKTIGPNAKGVGNMAVLKATQEVIITDYPMEALKLYQCGYHNVMLCPDASSASMVTCDKAIVLSYKNPEVLASAVNAKEIQYGFINGKDKTPSDALARVKPFKQREVLKTTVPILDKVVDDLTTLGYIGESNNKKIAYLISISRKLKRPLSGIIVSSSGAGKTGLMMAIAKLVPDSDKLLLSRLTPQALFNFPKDALIEKFIVVDERNGSSMADYSIRTMQTSNVLTIAKPKSKDNEGGITSIEVKCAYMESTTNEDINPENASRSIILHLDESPEATLAILKSQRLSRLSTAGENFNDLVKWHHQFQSELKSLPVIIPYIEELTFPYHRVHFRREQEKFLGLLEASALLHQHDRDTTKGIIVASVEDYKIAYDLYASVFKESQRELSKRATTLLECLQSIGLSTFTIREAISATEWTYSAVHRAVRELLQYEYLSQDTDKKGRHRKTYTVLDVNAGGITIVGALKDPNFSQLFNNFS
jgi:hypothetical protein